MAHESSWAIYYNDDFEVWLDSSSATPPNLFELWRQGSKIISSIHHKEDYQT